MFYLGRKVEQFAYRAIGRNHTARAPRGMPIARRIARQIDYDQSARDFGGGFNDRYHVGDRGLAA
jgi:hypothetical protein